MNIAEEPRAEEILDTLGQHTVGILVEMHKKGMPPFHEPLSGFLAILDGRWLIVTAGHSIATVKTYLAAGYNITCTVLDAWRGGQWGSTRGVIPFSWDASSPWFIYERGLDYGVLQVDQLTQRSMEANGKVPITEDNWNLPPDAKFPNYLMVGFPKFETRGTGVSFRCQYCGFPVERLDERPDVYLDEPEVPTLWGRVRGEESISGMSGGPIFGLGILDGAIVYFPVAIQSSWFSSERLIRAPLIHPLAKILREEFSKAATSHSVSSQRDP